MSDDFELANLLGEAPKMPDPGFRIDVFARVTERARRRAAFRKAVARMGAFAAVGLVFPVVNALRLDLAPVVLALGAVGLAYLAAVVTIRGPGALLQSSRLALRVRA